MLMPSSVFESRQRIVAVIISVYNAQPDHLKTQIESLLSQTYGHIRLYVRDDGSTRQETIDVLDSYANRGLIELQKGCNLGITGSFLSALNSTEGEDYYAFCDQDDCWLPDKIERAVRLLDGVGASTEKRPVLYYSHYDFYDGDLKYVSKQKEYPLGISFRNCLVDVFILGMTMVFNSRQRELMLLADREKLMSHDWWAYMVAAGLGDILEDCNVTVKYRRHSANSSQVGSSFIALLVFRIRNFVLGDSLGGIREQIREYDRCYRDMLLPENQRLIDLFLPGDEIRKAVKKVFYPRMFRQSIVDELMCRVMFAFGRL